MTTPQPSSKAPGGRRFAPGPRGKESAHTFSRDITLILVLAVFTAAGLIILAEYTFVSDKFDAQLNRQANEYLFSLQSSLELPLWHFDGAGIAKIGSAYFENDFISFIRVADAGGTQYFEASEEDTANLVFRKGPIYHGNEHLGVVEIGLTPRIFQESRVELLKSSIYTLMGCIAGILFAVSFLLRTVFTRPLNRLLEGIDRIASGDYDYSFPSPRQAELKTIMDKFNDMAQQVRAREDALNDINQRLQQEIADHKNAERQIKTLQEQVVQARKMEAIGTLAGGIAHDFNNILTIILGNTELALEETDDPDFIRQMLTQTRTAGLRARDVVRQLLKFSRVTDEKKVPVDILAVTEESLGFLRSSLPSSIAFKKRFPSRIDPILGDPTQIHQILLNLSTNAVHAMEENGGILELGLENVYLGEQRVDIDPALDEGPYVRLWVRDTGHGIPESLIGRIFDPYFTTKEVGRGSGMGLAVVHGIVKGHGGTITVSSKTGQGTLFTLYFPAVPGLVDVEREQREDIPEGTERILLVDDEPRVADLWQERLRRIGYTVETATDPRDALDRFRADPHRYDLVISDMTMPRLSGDKLLRKMMDVRPDLPTIICTGFSEKVDEAIALKSGIRGYLLKPMDMAQMAAAVRRALDTAVSGAGRTEARTRH